MNTCIKNVNESDWNFFKTEAVKNRSTLGTFFSKVLTIYKEKTANKSKNWNAVLYGKPTLTEEEAKKMNSFSKKFREEFSFR